MRTSDWKKYRYILAAAVLVALASVKTGFNPLVLLRRGEKFFDILKEMFPPDWTFASRAWQPLISTIQMALAGTVLGAALGLPTSFFCAAGVNKAAWLRRPLRFLIQLIRTIPALILALFLTFLTGIGMFAGTAALSIYTFGILTKLGYEDLENAPMASYHALVHAGSGKARAAVRGLLPEVLPSYLSNSLYLLESNVRGSAILGYVGAGGIGLLLNEKLSWRQYDKAGMVLIMLLGAVVLAEGVSEYLRYVLKEREISGGRDERGGREGRGDKGDKEGREDKRDGFGGMRFPGLAAAVLCCMLLAGSLYGVGLPASQGGIRVARAMVNGIFHPDLTLLLDPGPHGVAGLLLETVCIAITGTVAGTVLALPLALAGSMRLMPLWAAIPVRLLTAAVRTVPVFIYGLMCIRVTGPGAFAGALTLGITSVGLLTKRFQTAADNVDLGSWRAVRNMGVSPAGALRHGLWPQLYPAFASAALYRLDVNMREASILGLVGAGGIGAPLIMAMNQYKWNQAGALLLGLAAAVLLIEWGSGRLRRRVWL